MPMQTIQPLEAILFDPLSWMHPQRLTLTPGLSGARQRSIINDMIIASQGWSVATPLLTPGWLARQCVDQWHRLPQVALLIACQRHRALLARQGRIRLLPAWVRAFAELAIVESVASACVAQPTLGTLLFWGKNELLSGGELLPTVLSQRIALLFSPALDRENEARAASPDSPLLIKLAFQYAKRNPAIPDAADFWRSIN